MTTMMKRNNEYNVGAQFLAHLTPKEHMLVKTQTGANSLERKGPQMYWEWEMAKPVCKKRRWKVTQEDEEEVATKLIDKVWMDLAKQAAQGSLQEHMTKLDAMVYIRHGLKVLGKINKDEQNTQKTSLFILENSTLLHSLAWLMRHPVPVSVMLNDDLKYFEKLGEIFQIGATIAPETFRQIGVALIDGLVKCATEDMDWNAKNVFQKLESTGWLELYLVWAADKSTTTCKGKSNTLDLLKTCASFVRTTFQVGAPFGNKVREIVKKSDLFKQCPVAIPCYVDLIKISESVTCAYKYCDIMDSWDKMFHCGKCRKVNYCCKECQIAGWHEHMPMCSVPIENFIHHAMQQQSSGLDLC